MKFPIRSAWNRTWSSSSIRAKPYGQPDADGRPVGAALFTSIPDCCLQRRADLHQHVGARVAVVELMVEVGVARVLHVLARGLHPRVLSLAVTELAVAS